MKIRYLSEALIGILCCLTGCSEDKLDNVYSPWQEGDDIVIGARAGYENEGKTRTSFSGKDYTEGNKTFERIDWVEGDRIGIYCKEAINQQPVTVVIPGENSQEKVMDQHYGEYEVTQGSINNNNKESFATFSRVGNSSLQWGGQKTHTFYAIYPSISQNWGQEINNNIVKGVISVDQSPYDIVQDSKGNITAKPFMRQAYMVAKQTIDPATPGPVNLTFHSIVTVLELELKGVANENIGDNSSITGIEISSKNHNLTGKYTCNLKRWNGTGYPNCKADQTSEARKSININLHAPGDKAKSLKLPAGKTLKLTVFMLPIEDLNDLSITVRSLKGSVSRELKPNATAGNLVLKAHLKHRISNLSLPKAFNTNNWISRLDDHVLLSQLSIPGTGGSCSSKAQSASDKTQTLSLKEQWNMGIRAFEIMSTFPGDKDPGGDNLGTALVRTSRDNTVQSPNGGELSVQEAYNTIGELVKANPGEFAIVTFIFQPVLSSRDGGAAQTYINSLEKFLESETNYPRVLFDPNKPLGKIGVDGSIRGHIMVIARATSQGEDSDQERMEGARIEPHRSDYLFVDGWGSLQDKWVQRGYGTVNNPINQDYTQSVEYTCMIRDTDWLGDIIGEFKEPIASGNENYAYPIKVVPFDGWFQEWPRVVKSTTAPLSLGNGLYVKWFESYQEKLTAAKNAFDKSIMDKEHSEFLYINSLCGYYIDPNNENSYTPLYKWDETKNHQSWGSTSGDFHTFANDINRDFFAHVQQRQTEHTTGPMGIIMMNFVGNTAVEASCLMPGVVVANNFAFPLKTDGQGTKPLTKIDNAYTDGGAVIR